MTWLSANGIFVFFFFFANAIPYIIQLRSTSVILSNSIWNGAFNPRLIKQNKFIANYQMSTFIKSSCFACIIWHFPWSCSGSIKSSVAHCICLVRVAKTVLVWWMNDLDSSTSVSLHCIRLFFLVMFSSAASMTFA